MAKGEVADDRRARETVEGRHAGRAVRNPDAGVAEDGARDAVGVAGGHDGADRAAPVLGAEGEVAEIEGLHQGRNPLGVEVEGVDRRVAGFVARGRDRRGRGR